MSKPMTVHEVALMRQIVLWRRAHGITYWRARGIIGRFAQWSAAERDGKQVSVDFLPDGEGGTYFEMTAGLRQELGGLKISDEWSLTQAVDVLVALGYLPARFSSAYAAGWHASQVWEQHPATARRGWEAEFKRLFHDPENVSFPAVQR